MWHYCVNIPEWDGQVKFDEQNTREQEESQKANSSWSPHEENIQKIWLFVLNTEDGLSKTKIIHTTHFTQYIFQKENIKFSFCLRKL